MAALPGLTPTSLTKEPTKALVSVSSLVLRNSLISAAKAAMVSALSRNCRLSFSSALASSAAISSFSLRSRCSLMGFAPKVPVVPKVGILFQKSNESTEQGW